MSKAVKSISKTVKKVAPFVAPVFDDGPIGQISRAAAPFVASSIIPGSGSIIGALTQAGGFLGGKEKQPSTTYIYNGQPSTVAPAQAETFTPTQPAPLARPGTLNDLASFSPEQERSALATKGLNQGLGSEEDAYYRNLIQRSLIGSDNAVVGNMNSLLPIEQQYFQKKGLAMDDINSFLKGLSS